MSNPTAQIKACLNDEESYRKNRKPIIQQITAGNKVYSSALVDVVKTALKDKKEKSIPKFISLYFLKEAMDTQDPELIYAVRDKLLKTLAECAKSDTTKLFLPGTEDKILKNFDQLLLECIIFWAEWFGKDIKGKPTKFQSTYDEVFQKVEIPKKFSFFKKKKAATESQNPPESGAPKPPAGSGTKAPSSASRDLPPAGSGTKAPSSASRDLPPPTSTKTEQKPAMGKSSTPGRGGIDESRIEEMLKAADGIKEILTGILTDEAKPDQEMLAIIESQVRELNNDLQQSLNGLLGQESPHGEALLNRVLEESNFTSKYLDEFSKLQTNNITMNKFRDVIMNAILASKERNSPKKEKKKKEKVPEVQVPEPKDSKPPKSKFSKPENEPDIKSSSSNKGDPFDSHSSHHHHASSAAPQKDPFAAGFDEYNSAAKPNATSAFDQSNPFGGFDSAPAVPASGKIKNSFDDFGQGSATNKTSGFGDFNSTPAESEFRPTFGQKSSPPKAKSKNLSIKPPDNEFESREESKTRENPFNNIWDSNHSHTDPPKKSTQPRKSDAGFGFEDFGDFKFDDHYNARGADMDSSQAGGFNFDYDGGVKRAGTPNSVTAQDIFGETDFSKSSPRKEEFNFGSTKKEPHKKDEFGSTSTYESKPHKAFESKFESKIPKDDFTTFSDPHHAKTDFHSDFDSYKETKPDKKDKENYFGTNEPIKTDKTYLSPPPTSSILDRLSKIPPYEGAKIEPYAHTHTYTSSHTTGGAYVAHSTIPSKTYSGTGGTSYTPPRDRTPSPPVIPLSEVMTGMNFSPAHTALENARRAREGGLTLTSGPISSSVSVPIGGSLIETRISPPRTYISPNPRLAEPILETRFSPSRSAISPRLVGANVTGESVADIARRVREQTRVEGAPIYPISPNIRPVEVPISTTTTYMRSPALNATIEDARRRDALLTREVNVTMPPPTETIYTFPTMATTGRVISSPPHIIAEENPAIVPRQDYIKPSLLTGLNFVPKYTTVVPQPVVVEEVRVPIRDSIAIEQGLMPNLPDKYTRLAGGQPVEVNLPAPVTNFRVIETRQSLPVQQEVILTKAPEPIAQAQNPAWKKTSDLIERARKMRGDAVRNSAIFETNKDTKLFSTSLVDKADPMHHPNLEALHTTKTYNLGRRPSPGGERPILNQSARGTSPLKDHTSQGLNGKETIQTVYNTTNLAQTLKNEPRVWNNQGQGDTFGFEGYKTNAKENMVYPVDQRIQNVITQKALESRSISPIPDDEKAEGPKTMTKYSQFYLPAGRGSETKATKEERREAYQGFSTSLVDPSVLGNMKRIDFNTGKAQENSLEKEDARIRQVLGVPSMKYTVTDNYMQVTPTNFTRQAAPAGVVLEQGAQKGLTGKKDKVKMGKAMAFDLELFDQFTNLIYGYPTFRDIDAFKYACLVNRATIFENPVLQITSITKNEGPTGPSDEVMKTIVHYINKASTDIVNFCTFPHDNGIAVQSLPLIKGVTLTPKYQLKQEFLVGYHDLNCGPYVLDLTYKHEGQTKQMNIVLPITITKYMKFKKNSGRSNFKNVWKRLKPTAVSISYKRFNAKFLRNPTEINTYFENLCDITPTVNPKNKKKYGGVFVLPDNREYCIKFTLDSNRLKIMGSAGDKAGGSVELVIQYLAFLLTV